MDADTVDVIYELSAEIEQLKNRIAALERIIERIIPDPLRVPDVPEMRLY